MALKVAVNGFGRMGRLGLRTGWDKPQFEIVRVNEVATDAAGFLVQQCVNNYK